MNIIPKSVQRELDECGLPWRIEKGGKHPKLIVGEIFCGVLAKNGSAGARAELNLRSQVRRAVAATKGAK